MPKFTKEIIKGLHVLIKMVNGKPPHSAESMIDFTASIVLHTPSIDDKQMASSDQQ